MAEPQDNAQPVHRWGACGVPTCACIAPLVQALNDAGMTTISCCCGHGRQPSRISLADGREVFIAPDFETGQRVTAAFPPIHAESDDGPRLTPCPCWTCVRERTPERERLFIGMIVCPSCGNKRCPHATSHRWPCSGSNDVGQQGSRYVS